MTERIIGNQIRLIPYYRNDAVSLPWYRDRDVCKQVDNRDAPYDMELLRRMYDYLNTHGDCYYIEYEGELVGDVSLQDNAEIAIVVNKAFQNQHIGAAVRFGDDKAGRGKGDGTGKSQYLPLQHAEPAHVFVRWVQENRYGMA